MKDGEKLTILHSHIQSKCNLLLAPKLSSFQVHLLGGRKYENSYILN